MSNMVHFTKMHGAGNDYIYIDAISTPIKHPEKVAVRLSDRHLGIGGDGLVLICSSSKADFGMRIFNADGSEAMMCGNASRCIGKYVYESGMTEKTELTLETLSGIKRLRLHLRESHVESVTVDMGLPTDGPMAFNSTTARPMHEEAIEAGGFSFKGTTVSMGNPHLVIFVDDMDKVDLSTIGPLLENHPLFPDRINVEFAQVLSPGRIRMRVWERGSGITQACGTGACATVVVAFRTGRAERRSEIIMDGGTLDIEQDPVSNHVLMTGPATKVFEGEIDLGNNYK